MAQHGGQNCTGEKNESCKIKECPGKSSIDTIVSFFPKIHILFNIFSVDCKWSIWSSCSEDCGLGNRTRSIEVMAQHSGQNCTGNDTESCKIIECPG